MRSDTLRSHRARVARARDYIQRNLGSDLRLDTLAHMAGTSPYHFHRMFLEHEGETPSSQVRRLRLDRAAMGLIYTAASIRRIGRRAGYEAHESFSRAFQARFRCSPSSFRQKHSAGPRDPVEFSIQRLRRRTIAFLPCTGPYDGITRRFEQLQAWAAPRGLLAGSETLGVYYDDQEVTDAGRTRYEAGLVVSSDVANEGRVRVRDLPDCEYAVVSVEGPTDKSLRPLYRDLAAVLTSHGRSIGREPSFEVYTGSQTRVHVPLA